MRDWQTIHNNLVDSSNWGDADRSRKAHQMGILIEVLVDIRDVLGKLAPIHEKSLSDLFPDHKN